MPDNRYNDGSWLGVVLVIAAMVVIIVAAMYSCSKISG